MYDSFGQALRQLRQKAGISQRELAERIGFDDTSISKFESGQRVPSADMVLALCGALGVPEERLLALVGKLPTEVEKAVATNRHAQEFLREAQLMGLTDSEWKGLRCCLSRMRQESGGTDYHVLSRLEEKATES